MLTLGDGFTIGIFIGGACDGEFLSIRDIKKCCKCCDYCDEQCKFEPCCRKCKNQDVDLGEQIEIKDEGRLMFTPLTDTRDIIFAAAESGAGKSFLTSKYVELYHDMFPNNPVLLFSRKFDDPAYQKSYINIVNINRMDPKCNYDIINMPKFKNGGLVIFDDTSTILDKKINDCVNKIMHDLMQVARAAKIYMVITAHALNPTGRKDNKMIWIESKSVVAFPQSINRYEADYTFSRYLGFKKDIIDKILELPSRWVAIRKTPFGKVVLYEKGAFIPNYKGPEIIHDNIED